jgi:DNA polymerase-3 subunit gamma/tau
MAYTALYRVWRPQTFGDIVGQAHVTRALRNAVREGRLSHAYLFNGPRGTGKTSAAKIMAKAVNCQQPVEGEPCNRCKSCEAISSGLVTDVLEIDAASNRGVEEIRDIRERVKFAPSDVSYKVYIIDEVHMLTTEAFNALLKTLEEPPPHVLFILATTEPHKLPATIISRCQRFDFHRIPLGEIVGRLRQICEAQQVEAEDQALQLVAKVAEGGMRDALSLLDQAISFGGGAVKAADILQITGAVSQTYFSTLAKFIIEGNVTAVMEQFDQIMVQGKDPEQFLHDFLYYYRDMLLLKTAPRLQEIVERTLIDEEFAQVAERYELPVLYPVIESLNQSLSQLKWSTYARVLTELTLVKLCQIAGSGASGTQAEAAPARATSAEDLVRLEQRVRSLEEKLARGVQQNVTGARPQEEGRPPARRQAASAAGRPMVQIGKLREIARQVDVALTQRVRGMWGQILAELKKVKIQHHAWLVSGQPAAASSEVMVVTFKSSIHCEKTMEPELKGIVERIIREVCGTPLQLLSVMEEQWQEAEAASAGKQDTGKQEDPFIAEALKLVGEELLEVKD